MTPLSLPGDLDVLAQSCGVYLALLQKWNQAYNLTAVRSIHDMVGRHILDSLAILPWITGRRVLDVGTGAGLPGIPLALACPDKQVVLLDSNGKKTRFLAEVQRVLDIKNIEIIQSRVETYQPTLPFDTVVSRAFSEMQTMLDQTQHLLAPGGQWVAMKGSQVNLELSSLTHAYRLEPYTVADVEGERCCVIIDYK
ncbi:MAG: 16S rRNA (guanine(527)-N(7))-methyltransferase RsmG [Legionella sp.]|nr:MAG: 16S rRNA (guanine(527)-N(7))-methyltransferase RsmG [Legionella sp.]